MYLVLSTSPATLLPNSLDMYRLSRVLAPVVPLLQGSAVYPSVATGTGIQGKSAGLPRVRAAWAVITANALFSVRCGLKDHWVSCIYFRDYGSGDVNGIYVALFVFLIPREPYNPNQSIKP